MKKILKTRKFYMLSAILLSIVGVIVFFISNALSNKGSIEFKAYTGYYESDQHPITDIVNSEDGKPYYSIKNFYDNFDTWSKSSTDNVTPNPKGFNSSEYIGIDDMTDLVAFSRLCNPDFNNSSYTSFLGYKYILTNNITTTSSSLYFMPIGTDSEHPFSGEFNGNGYDITNMSFVNIQSTGETDHFKENYPKTQEKIQYFAMFSNNKGTICNFGIINANLSFNYSSNGLFYKVAMICGENQTGGTINKVYVRDLRDADNKRAGIMPFGGYTISGLVFSNKGTVSNSYVAYSTVVNGAVDDFSDFSELIYENSGTESNLFFYNDTITKIGTSETYEGAQSFDKSSVEIVYSSLGMQVKRTVYGTYCQKLEYLDIAINATNTSDKIWYVPSNYGTAEDDVKTLVVTPMLRGLEFNDNVFSIKSIRDYAFMYELFNSNAALNNGKYTYQIESNINLEYLSADRYKYKGGIAANITGKTGTYTGVTINGSTNSIYPTIYCPNFKDTFVTVEGFNAFGLFPYLTGTVSNLNIVASKTKEKKVDNETVKENVTNTVNLTVSGNNNIATFGIVSGYVDIGTINNVNVYGYLEFTGTAKAFIGGAVGVLTGNATAHNVTSAGSLTSSITAVTQNQGNYLNGNVVGGVVGYTDFALANVYTLLNSMNINTNGVSNSVDLVVGGVVGAGYTAICNNLQNEGTITIGTDDTDAVYNSLYVAGVFGRHLGQTEQVNGLTNYGNITVYNNDSYPTYVCGSVNATPITKNVANLEVNNYKSNGKYYYRATKIINGANITINKASTNNHYTDVINVITNECVTRLSGVYNLAYSKNRGAAKTTALGAKAISMNKFSTYSPVLNYEHSGDYDEAIISTVYNLRDIEFTMNEAISTNVTYTGVIKGTNVSMIDVRNEGNLTFTIDKALTGNLNIFGIIEEISANATASSLYNGGDIKVTYTEQITGNVNISGICYKNNNTSLNTLINNYNPNLDTFDADALGEMDSTINAGNIELTNPNYETGIKYKNILRKSNNNQQYLAYFYNPEYSGSYIAGNINVAGITNINYSVITNTFNVGDVFVANVCKENGYKINAAGITDLNIGQYAYILNSGNNGDIKAINLYNRTDNSVSDTTLVRTDLTVAGIIARNDLTDALSNYNSNNGHSKQVVAFTINYGSIYAYNYNENVEGSNQEPNCKASGIVGMGLLNVVNVLNYGNIFGSETTSGIFGVVYFARFQGEVKASNPVKIANTINYGNTYILYKGYNSIEREAQASINGSNDYTVITYKVFKGLALDDSSYKHEFSLVYTVDRDIDNQVLYTNGYNNDKKVYNLAAGTLTTFTAYTFYTYQDYTVKGSPSTSYSDGEILLKPGYYTIDENGDYVETLYYDKTKNYYIKKDRTKYDYTNYTVSREVNNKSINGSIFSIINFNGNSNAQYVTIRYLINFEENVPLVGFEPNTPNNVSVERSTIYSAYTHLDTRNNGSGQMVRDTYMSYISESKNNYVVYSPLTDETNAEGVFVTTDSSISVTNASDVKTATIKYNGVFSKDFDFYEAITKQYTKAEIAANPTDAFLSDFFQFVEYSYINDVLVDKIGWKEIAYATAANTFARSTANVKTLLNKLSEDSKDYSTYTTYALSDTSIWTKWASGETLTEVINELIAKNDTENLEKMLEYIFSSDSKSNVLITKELREEIYEIIVSKITGGKLSSILTKIITYENGYSSVLAEAILENNGDVHKFIDEYLKTLDLESIKSVLSSYISILEDDTTQYFDYSTNSQFRLETLNSMFKNIDGTFNNYFYETLCNLLNVSSSSGIDDKLKMYQGYNTLNNSEKFKLYLMIIENNTATNTNSYLDVMEGEIGYYNKVIKSGYITTDINDTYNRLSTDETTNESTVIDERVALWNQIKNTTTFKNYLKSRMPNEKYYFLATEHRNTYQSNTAPSPNGATDGDLSYYYTPVVTPSTYFYGPYKSASDDGKSKTDFGVGGAPNNAAELYPTGNLEQSGVYSVFIADNLTYFGGYYKKENNSFSNDYLYYSIDNKGEYTELGTNHIQGVRNAGLYLYEYGYTGANNQFCSGSTVDSDYYKDDGWISDFGGSKLKTSNAILTYKDKTTGLIVSIDLSNAAISGHTRTDKSRDNYCSSGSFEIIDSNGNKYTISEDNISKVNNYLFTITDPDLSSSREESGFWNASNKPLITARSEGGYTLSYKNSGNDIWGDVLIRYGRNYYFSYVDETYHPTKKTGIYRYKSGCNNMHGNVGISWFTHKPGAGNNVTWTSQYIDYTRNQLLELDGIYTDFSGNPISEDERNIINAIFNNYFCTDYTNFEYIVRKALLEKIGYDVTQYSTVSATSTAYHLSGAVSEISYGDKKASDRTSSAYAMNETKLSAYSGYYNDWYDGANGIKGSVYYNRWMSQANGGTKRTSFDITYTNVTGNSPNANNLTITSYRNDTQIGSITNKTIAYSNNYRTLTITLRSDINGYRDDVTIILNVTTSGSNDNRKLTSATFEDASIYFDGNNGDSRTRADNGVSAELPRPYHVNWYNSSNSISGGINYIRNYYRNGNWDSKAEYQINVSVSNIEFDKNKKIINYTPTLSGTRTIGNQTTNINSSDIYSFRIAYSDGYIYVSFKVFAILQDVKHFDLITIPVKVELQETTNVEVNDPYSVSSTDDNYLISNSENEIATIHINSSNNQFTSVVDYDNDKYFIRNIFRENSNKKISFEYISYDDITVDYIKFIDAFVSTNINSNMSVNSKSPFEFLKYSASQTVKQYLMSKVSSAIEDDYKTLLITNALSNETTYYKLIKKLLELNVLSEQEMSEALNVTITGATAANANLNIDNSIDNNSFNYIDNSYSTLNKYGFTATSLTLDNLNGFGIIAKGTSNSSSMTLTVNGTIGSYTIPNSEIKVISASGTENEYTGNVSYESTNLYVVSKESLYDFDEMVKFKYNTQYYYLNDSNEFVLDETCYFDSSTTYYRYDNGNPGHPVTIYNADRDRYLYDNTTQLYSDYACTIPVNDINKTYYVKTENVAPSVTINMDAGNVVIYDIMYVIPKIIKKYTQKNQLTFYYYWQNNEVASNVKKNVTIDTLANIKKKIEATDEYKEAIKNSSGIAEVIRNSGWIPLESTYSYTYDVNTVDSQFVIYNNFGTENRRVTYFQALLDETLNNNTAYTNTTKAKYIFTNVGKFDTQEKFNAVRDSLYFMDDSINKVYSNNKNSNGFLGSDGHYYKKVDFAKTNKKIITIEKGDYDSDKEYYTLSFEFENALAQFHGKYNKDAIINANNNNNSFVTSIDDNDESTIIETSSDNDALKISARYNLQTGVISKSTIENDALSSGARVNAGVFLMGNGGIAVISPYANTTVYSNPDHTHWQLVRNNCTEWIDESKFESLASLFCSDTTVIKNEAGNLASVSSSSINDQKGTQNYSGLIDIDSLSDCTINLYDKNDVDSSKLGHRIGNYKCQPMNSSNNPTSQLYEISVENPDNYFISNVIYKVSYEINYEMEYEVPSNDGEKIITYDFDQNKYLSSRFYGTNKSVSTDNHTQEFRDILANLLPICTNDYAYIKATTEELNNNFDAANLYEKSTVNGNSVYTKTTDTSYDNTKTYYKLNDMYIYDIKNRLLKYLSDNPKESQTITIDGKEYKLTIENLYKLLTCYSNESFINFLKASYSEGVIDKTKYTLILEDLLSKNAGYTYIADVINEYHNISLEDGFNAKTKVECDRFITAAALASEYENKYQQSIVGNNSALLASSKLKELLDAVNVIHEGTSIQYINNDGSFDNDKFDALLDYIGLGGNNDVYGIYALSSSKGIKNGDFIPDNLNLESHNAYYKAGEYGLELLPESSLDYAYWRINGKDPAPKYGDKYTGYNATTYSDSVNYAFLIEMKQLQKSIATTLFELDLNTSVATSQLSDYTMYSSQSLINEITKASDATEKNHYAITYYVPSVYLNDIIDNNKDLEIVELIKSSSATVYTDTAKTQEAKIRTESIAGTKFSGFVPATSLSSNTNYRSLDGCYVLENAIIIRAEDERVYSYYDILLKPMDFSFDMQYQQIQGVTNYDTFSTTSATVASTDGVISLNLTSPVIYVNTTDNTVKPGAVYYTRTGTEGNYVYTKADLTVGQSINPDNYYSTYTKAVEAGFREGITYYIKTLDNNKYVYTEADLTNHVITDNTYYIASEATKLPTGFDLAPYVKIRKQGSGGASIPNSFTLLNEAGNHVVKADGSADITLEILDTLEAGNYDVVVDLYGAEVKLPLTKLPNPNNDFTAVYDGKDLAFNKDGDNYVATTEILWGQPFAKYALLDLSYLDSFTKSPNSTVEVTTEYNVTGVDGNNVNYDIATYTVKIDVTSESGVTKHYQHKLVEMDPFRTKVNNELVANDLYATLYEDGVVIGNAKLGQDITNSDKWTVKDNIMNVSFSRDKGEPNYRAKYSYKNIYYSLNNKVYSYEEYDAAGNIINTESSVKILYAGFNVVVTSACDTGTYTFGYVMNNPTYQEIDYYEYDEDNNNYFITADILAIKDKDYYTYNLETDEYTKATLAENAELAKSRKLVFPKLRIEKTPSLNALVESATFIDGYEALGALATLVYPDYSIVPSNQVKAYDSNEPVYSTLIDGTQKISVDPTDRHITYEYKVGNETTNYATSTNNYYIVGTTSDASLERYAPTITLQDDYAKLFRFVSPHRNSNYDGKKEATDYSILNNHDDNQIYLYVPFEIDGEEDVLMVKVNVKDMSYEEVWDTTLTKCYASYNKGDGTLKKDGENPTPYKGKELYDITFEYDGHTYEVSHYAGSVSANNSSLFDSYAEECENSRFWYVSYVVFSEDFFMNGLGKEPETATNADWGNRIKYYNVAIIDVSNNIRFILEVDAPEGFMTETNLESIYTTFAYNKYSSTILTDTKQLSAYVEYKDKLYVKNEDDYVLTTGALDGSTQYYFYDQTTKGFIPVEWSTKGTVYDTYVSNYGIQLLPTAYYRFNLDLPSGYVATYKASKVNTYNPETSEISEDGSYLPPSSIVTQTIKITITIERGNVENTSSWGISTSNVTTIVATAKTN